MAALLAVAIVAVAALVLVARADERRLAFTTGVTPTDVAATLHPGDSACQVPVVVSRSFSRVHLYTGTFKRPGQPLELTVRGEASDAVLARGRLAGGYGDGSQPTVVLHRSVAASQAVAVCFRNAGRRRVALYGGGKLAARNTTVVLNGKPRPRDLTLVFDRAAPRSALALVPEMLARASLFRPGWAGSWLFWTLLLAVAAGVPGLLALALRDSRG